MKRSSSILVLSALVLLFVSPTNAMVDVPCFSDEFLRGTGPPITENRTFQCKSGPATIRLTNNRISSATVTVNGIQVFGPPDFNQNVTILEKQISLNDGDNTISVQSRGKPGGTITILITHEVDADAAAYVGPEGGVVEGALAKVEIPEGTVDTSALFTVSLAPPNVDPPNPDLLMSEIIEVKCSSNLNGYVFISIPLQYNITLEDSFRAFFYNEENYDWEITNIIDVDLENNSVAVATTHLTVFAVEQSPLLSEFPTIGHTDFKYNRDLFHPKLDNSAWPIIAPFGKCAGLAQYPLWYHLNIGLEDDKGLSCRWNYDNAKSVAKEAHSVAENIDGALKEKIYNNARNTSVKTTRDYLLTLISQNKIPTTLLLGDADGWLPKWHNIIVYGYYIFSDDKVSFDCYDSNRLVPVEYICEYKQDRRCGDRDNNGQDDSCWLFDNSDIYSGTGIPEDKRIVYDWYIPSYLGNIDSVHSSFQNITNKYEEDWWCVDFDPDKDGVYSDGDGEGEIGDRICNATKLTVPIYDDLQYPNNIDKQSLCDDNCPGIDNPDQADSDGDGIGDDCEPAPQVTGFSVTPTAVTAGNPITASYTVTDNQDLSRVELWRAPYKATNCNETNQLGCEGVEVGRMNVSGTSYTDRITDETDEADVGTWWYGIHVIDSEENCTTQLNRDCTTGESNGGPLFKPVMVTVSIQIFCVDIDNDTYDACDLGEPGDDGKPKDCNDEDKTIYPGALEECDNKDNQCPGDPGYGQVDEGCDEGDIPRNGLVAFYPFEGNANDESGNENHGTVYGAVLSNDRFGNNNQAYYFDGVDDYIEVADDPTLNFGFGDFTISAWVKTNYAPNLPSIVIIDKRTHTDDFYYGYCLFHIHEGRIGFQLADGSYSNWISYLPINNDKWQLITVTVDRGVEIGGKIYVNGQIIHTFPTSYDTDSLDNVSNLFIAQLSYGGHHFKGNIDDISMYNRVLSDEEVQTLFHIGQIEDFDGDGVIDKLDNCPEDFNPGQDDADENGIGDYCHFPSHWALPDTGQVSSYTETFGQDSDYNSNQPSFTKLDINGNALPYSSPLWPMVRDNVTGLIWETKTVDWSIHRNENWYTWQDAQDNFIFQLNADQFGGFNDWRLPNIKELMNIVNREIDSDSGIAVINTDYFPNTYRGYYWSSTLFADAGTAAWTIHFGVGLTGGGSSNPVRAVRGVPYGENNFINNGDGTVTDANYGLMWQQETTGPIIWEEALSYCENLQLSGYDDWRLPNIHELHSIVDYSVNNPSIDSTVFPDTVSNSYYWSSTTVPATSTFAWSVRFTAGNVYGFRKTDTAYMDYTIYGRCVRGRQN